MGASRASSPSPSSFRGYHPNSRLVSAKSSISERDLFRTKDLDGPRLLRTAAAAPAPQGSARHPDVAITNATAGEALRADLDSGGVNRQEVLVTIFVKDPAGGSSAWHTERVYVGDGPAEYIGPLLPENFRKRLIRVRITDVVSGEILADDIDRVG